MLSGVCGVPIERRGEGIIQKNISERFFRRIEVTYGPPLIIMGAHRSGTSLITRILRAAGGYFGAKLDPNSEPLIFIRLNHTLLNCLDASWHIIPSCDFDPQTLGGNKRALTYVFSNRKVLLEEFFHAFGELGSEEYSLQPEEYQLPYKPMKALLSCHRLPRRKGMSPFWGWKDPRNTWTSSLWLRLFPHARLIHVIRNGIDSALSLWRRCTISGVGSPWCLDLEYCFELWERYVKEGLRYRSLAEDCYHEIRYEDLLLDPLPCLQSLLSFCGPIQVPAEALVRQIYISKSRNTCLEDYPNLIQRARRSEPFKSLGYCASSDG